MKRPKKCRIYSKQEEEVPGAPWRLSNYFSKKLTRVTEPDGEIVQSIESLVEPPGWNDASKFNIAVQAVSDETGMPVEELLQNVAQLQRILPDLTSTNLKTAEKVKLALDVDFVATRLIELREMLPGVDVSDLAVKRPILLSEDVNGIAEAVSSAKDALENAGGVESFEGLLCREPSILNVELLTSTLNELTRLFPNGEAAKLLEKNPRWMWTLQGLKGQQRGGRDPEYVRDMEAKRRTTGNC